jgi:hypothetical protein
MWVHHLEKAPVLVQTEKQREALGAGWYESPEEARDAASPVVSAVTVEIPSRPPAVPPVPTPLDITKMSRDEAVLYVGAIDSLDELARAAGLEEEGPNRVTVKRAIEARLEVLAKAPVSTADAPPASDAE